MSFLLVAPRKVMDRFSLATDFTNLVDHGGLYHLRTGLKGWFFWVACTLMYEVVGVRFRLTNLFESYGRPPDMR